jgi:glyoxylase-like metal-dependent hydrolase (beta-lactamase superfamily II)
LLRSRKLGEFRVSSLVEYFGPTHVPEKTFPDLDRNALEQNRNWLVPNHWYPEVDRLVISIQIWIVHAGSNIILIDSGVGNRKKRPADRMNMLNTLVPQWLDAAGALREKVTHVAMTHLHTDHVGWNTILEDGKWVPTFPNARYLIPKENYNAWRSLIESGKGAPEGGSFLDSIQPIIDAGLADFITDQKEATGCLEIEPLPGHTPGHLNYRVRSNGEQGVFGGDVMHHPLQIVCPKLNSAFCMIPDLARRNRLAFLNNAADTGTLIMPCHFGPPHCGYVRRQADGFVFEAAEW